MLSDDDLKFIEKRKKINKYWPIIGITLPLMLISVFLYLFLRTPKLANPYHVVDLLNTNKLDPTSMSILSVICPLTIDFLFITMGILIIYVWLAVKMERKYIRMIDELKADK
ncbi:MAG: hypothetical protein K8T10_11810 [Candidatus Eremiobacteraeota bacterium]|nr:hypothetical protein [Candidatus Eremiobacteraeota bacterium]